MTLTTDQGEFGRCGTAAGRVAPAHGEAPAVRIVPPETPLSLALSLKRHDMSPYFLPGVQRPDNIEEIRRGVRVVNEFLLIAAGDLFAGVLELIPLSARSEPMVVRLRLVLAMDAAAYRAAIVREVLRVLWSLPIISKLVVFVDDGEDTTVYTENGFELEGNMRCADARDGAAHEVHVLGALRADMQSHGG